MVLKKLRMLIPLLIVILAAGGCQVLRSPGRNFTPTAALPATPPPMPTATSAEVVITLLAPEETVQSQPGQAATSAPVEPPPTGMITREMAENFTYTLETVPGQQLPLQNGRFEVTLSDPPTRVTSELVDKIGFGDLNGDGFADAAVLLRTNTGGSGTFYDLVALVYQGGAPVQAGAVYIGDRQGIQDLRVEEGRILLDYLTQGPQDPLCCPSQRVLRTYRLESDGLKLVSEQVMASPEQAATPVPVQIFIDQPAWWAELTGSPIEVRGRIDRVPAAGFVEYALTDYSSTLLESGQISVQGDPGGPGTFFASIPFDRGAITTPILTLEIIDSADAILYGRTVVKLLLK